MGEMAAMASTKDGENFFLFFLVPYCYLGHISPVAAKTRECYHFRDRKTAGGTTSPVPDINTGGIVFAPLNTWDTCKHRRSLNIVLNIVMLLTSSINPQRCQGPNVTVS